MKTIFKRKRLVSIMLFFGVLTNVFAQDQKVSATVAFPITVGDFDYTGWFDIGVQYRFVKAGPVHIGVAAHVDYLRDNIELGSITIKESAILIQPRVFGELQLPTLQKLKPFVGIGYTFVNFKSAVGANGTKNNEGGINFNLGTAYNISNNFFVHLQFDTTLITIDGSIRDEFGQFSASTASLNLSFLKAGVGIRF